MRLPSLRPHIETPRLVPRRKIRSKLQIVLIQSPVHPASAQFYQRVGMELLIMERIHTGQPAAGELIIKSQFAPKAAVAGSQYKRRKVFRERLEMIEVQLHIWIRMVPEAPPCCAVHSRPLLRQFA